MLQNFTGRPVQEGTETNSFNRTMKTSEVD